MTPHREWFLNYRDIGGGKVLLGNNHECNIKGIGDIKIKMHDGIIRTLISVRYVPELKRNLISLGELDKNGDSYRGGWWSSKDIKRLTYVHEGCPSKCDICAASFHIVW